MILRHNTNRNAMTMQQHMRELRVRCCLVLAFMIALFCLNYANCAVLIDRLTSLGTNLGYTFIYISPQEVLIQQIRVSFVFTILLTLPLCLYQVIMFIAPACTDIRFFRIKALTIVALTFAFLLCGMIFAYKVILPFTYRFLYSVSSAYAVQSSVSIKEYISLFLSICISLGVVFELPFICVSLTRIGIITSAALKRNSRVMIVIAFIFGAIITPPDVISQIMVALPVILLYYISVILCSIVDTSTKTKE